MIYILNKNMVAQLALSKNYSNNSQNIYYDDMLEIDLKSGAETYTFTALCSANENGGILVGNYVVIEYHGKTKVFQIMATEEKDNTIATIECYCETVGMELLNSIFRARTITNVDAKRFLENVLVDTSWSVGEVDSSLALTNDITIDKDKNIFSILQTYLYDVFGAEIEFDVYRNFDGRIIRKINLYKQRGKLYHKRLDINKNIDEITRKVDITNLCTALIAEGKNGTKFTDIELVGIDKPIGQDFIVDWKAYEKYNVDGKHLYRNFTFDTESPEELLREANKALPKYTTPQLKYTIKANVFSEIFDEDLYKLEIGDTLLVTDHNFVPPLFAECRVGNLKVSKTNPMSSEATYANFRELNSNISSIKKIEAIEKDITDVFDNAKSYADNKASEANTNANNYTDSKLVDYVDMTTHGLDLEAIQSQIDGNITTWFYDYEPTLVNIPAGNWNTTELKNQHLGDIFYDNFTGYCYRFALVNSIYEWSLIKDSDVTKALADASKAQDTADNKRRVFVNTPTPPYDIGDLWTEGSTGDLYSCKVTRIGGSYISTDWEKATKYTDDSKADSAYDLANSKLSPNQLDVFNAITNGGIDQGVYLYNGKIYINGEYIKVGTVIADTVKANVSLETPIVTGGTIRTASSGNRVEVTTGGLNCYNASNLLHGCTINRLDGAFELYKSGIKVGYFNWDTTGEGTPEEATNRIFLKSLLGYALKLESGSDMSIGTPVGKKVYVATDELYLSGNLNVTGIANVQGERVWHGGNFEIEKGSFVQINSSNVVLNFSNAFSGIPTVILTHRDTTGATSYPTPKIVAKTTSSVTIALTSPSNVGLSFDYIAIWYG